MQKEYLVLLFLILGCTPLGKLGEYLTGLQAGNVCQQGGTLDFFGVRFTWENPACANGQGPVYAVTDNKLSIAIPDNRVYDYWYATKDAPQAFMDAPSGDYVLQTKVTLATPPPAAGFHTGLMLRFADAAFVFGPVFNDRTVIAGKSMQKADGAFDDEGVRDHPSGGPVYLRITKKGTAYYFTYSNDGDNWRSAGSRIFTETPKIGFIVKTWNAQAFTTEFSEFSLAPLPSAASIQDDFSSSDIQRPWVFSVPKQGSSYSLTDHPGHFRITLPNDKSYDHWVSADDAPQFRRKIYPTDFTLETKVTATGAKTFHSGLMIYFQPNDILIWGLVGDDNGNKRLWLQRSGQLPLIDIPVQGDTVRLRITKNPAISASLPNNAFNYDFQYSFPNIDNDWHMTSDGRKTFQESPTKVGIISKTWTPQTVVSDFDYVSFTGVEDLGKDSVPCVNEHDCQSNNCVHSICRPTNPFCGDTYCDSGETPAICPADCKKGNDMDCTQFQNEGCHSGHCVQNKCCPTAGRGYYRDEDSDGVGILQSGQDAPVLCDPNYPFTATTFGDCDDANPNIQGGTVYYKDADGDRYGVTTDTRTLCSSAAPYTATQGGDCDDNNGGVNLGAGETCNQRDDDCDGQTDEAADNPCAAGQTCSQGRCSVTASVAQCTSPSGIVAWLRGEDNARDTASGREGVLGGTVTYESGQVGKGFRLKTSLSGNSHIRMDGNYQFPQNEITLATWFKINQHSGAGAYSVLVGSAGNQYHLQITSQGQIVYGPGVNFLMPLIATPTITHGRFYHLVMTLAGRKATIYLDGEKIHERAQDIPQTLPSTSFFSVGPISGFVDAVLDETKVFSKALSADEIKQMYNREKAGRCEGVSAQPACIQQGTLLKKGWSGVGIAADHALHADEIIVEHNHEQKTLKALADEGVIGDFLYAVQQNQFVKIPFNQNPTLEPGKGYFVDVVEEFYVITERTAPVSQPLTTRTDVQTALNDQALAVKCFLQDPETTLKIMKIANKRLVITRFKESSLTMKVFSDGEYSYTNAVWAAALAQIRNPTAVVHEDFTCQWVKMPYNEQLGITNDQLQVLIENGASFQCSKDGFDEQVFTLTGEICTAEEFAQELTR